jgi:hypothetical protein
MLVAFTTKIMLAIFLTLSFLLLRKFLRTPALTGQAWLGGEKYSPEKKHELGSRLLTYSTFLLVSFVGRLSHLITN